MRFTIKEILAKVELGSKVVVCGWIRKQQGNNVLSFLKINDGSCFQNIQVVVNISDFQEDVLRQLNVGSCLKINGVLVESEGNEQAKEIQAESIEVYGNADPSKYKLQPKKHSLDFLRSIAHLRPRTTIFSSVFRLRHGLAFAVHKYFNDKGFYYWNSPIITDSDAEGAGETFKITTLDLEKVPKTKNDEVDFSNDFFGKAANLAVTGQLEGELGALGMGAIYTFGPTFRAENSNTTRHLSEFWMIEPEMAFYDAKMNGDLAEDLIKYIVKFALDNYPEELAYLHSYHEKENKQKKKEERPERELLDSLKYVLDTPFERVTYTEAVEILKKSKPSKKNTFKVKVEWGIDLKSEHERYLVEKVYKKPTIITDYPKEIKPFYMKVNEDGKTVKAMDILFPRIGEVVGGSQREDRIDVLKDRMDELGVPQEKLWWYLETRQFGTAPHSGFGMGFERMVQFVTGMGNIRDVIPFPRTPLNAEF